MKTRVISMLLLACAVGGALAAHDARAASIYRCATADGSSAYTDGKCSAIGARPAPMSDTLARTLLRSTGAATEAFSIQRNLSARDGDSGAYATGSGRGPALAGCPRTADQLQSAFEQSLASGDVNQLAAVYDWTNVSSRQSRDLLQRLERMSQGRTPDSCAGASVRRRAGCLLLSL